MRTCSQCNLQKPLVSFAKNSNGNRSGMCRCCKEKKKKQNKNKREQAINQLENIQGENGKVKVTHINNNWETYISLSEARLLFQIGCAKVVDLQHIIFFNFKELKKHTLQRDHSTCAFCGEFGDTVDHIIPKSKGGYDLPSNFITSCEDCNKAKSSQPLIDFLLADKNRKKHFYSSQYFKYYQEKFKELQTIG